jgi:chemosensory pili system protein ChpA (sensor histidine kinase/response regulator)
MEELKRHLHTLKGGARMAGIVAMGNLSHELEALLINIDDERIAPSTQIDDLLQLSIDQLHSMRDMVIAGKKVSPAEDLEKRIHALNAGDLSAAEPPPVTDTATEADLDAEAVPVEFTSEPEEKVSMLIVDQPVEQAAEEAEEIAAADEKVAQEEPVEIAAEEPVEEELPELAVEEIAEEEPAVEVSAALPQRSGDARQEFARIDADLLESLLNAAGEISIYHSRLSQQINTIEFHVDELDQTVARLREQLRKLEIETEAQIKHGHQDTVVAQDFDPLELDRYSNIQQLSRALAESANDMGSLKELLQSVTADAETLLVQQARVTAELQDGLMRTRMVPFQQHVPRLTRLVRQAAAEAGKRAELAVEGASGELDRQVLDKMLPPFEHMLRNAIIHGLEKPDERQAAGKPATGRITMRLHREGTEMVIDVADDGAGLDVEAIRRKAYETDLLDRKSKVTDDEIMQLILTPGFSTASKVTQSAGRGVGMDVVANEVKQLGGSLRISSVTGQGSQEPNWRTC